MEAICGQLINPVDSRDASLDIPSELEQEARLPEGIPTLDGFAGMGEGEIDRLRDELGLAMSLSDLELRSRIVPQLLRL